MSKVTFKYKFDDLFNPMLDALHRLGGSGSVSEIEDQVAAILNLTEDEVNYMHKGNITVLAYKLAWTRNYLKGYGLIENSSRGVWSLTEKGLKTKKVDKTEVKRFVRQKGRNASEALGENGIPLSAQEIEDEVHETTWQDVLLDVIKRIDPIAFERLCQRLLRELGFQNVEVTQRTNDGGIDGLGLLKIGSVISFRCAFQSKRYKETVSTDKIRDFRGAIAGRADRGVIITTGTFTREARKEAIRDGAIPYIDLIDGYELAQKLKELQLGVSIELVEKVNIKEDWFKAI
ncbi:MAG: restriction endonuclease [Lewinellaceae bacterium]|nr:restriction endonuclease [Lewinellaceae bacterium]